MDRPCHQLLARAAFSDNQDRRVRVGRVRDLLVNAKHAGGPSDQPWWRHVDVRSRGRRRRRRVGKGALDSRLHFRDVERLADVVVRACPYGLNRRLQRAEAADQDDVSGRIAGLERAQHVHAVLWRIQVDVGDQEVERFPCETKRLVCPLGRANVAARLIEQLRHEPAGLAVIVNDQDFRHGSRQDCRPGPAGEV